MLYSQNKFGGNPELIFLYLLLSILYSSAMTGVSSPFALQTVPLAQTKQFSELFLNYINQNTDLQPLYGLFPTAENFEEQAEIKSNFSAESRHTLVNALRQQYAHLTVSEVEQNNMSALLQPNTFTITTGHQLNIFTGPLYFVYKIATVVKAAQQLNTQYPDYQFVPVYWAATEDHDAAEINHFSLFGKTYNWETAEKGAVGRFSTEGLDLVLDSLPEKFEVFERAYRENNNLADATRSFVHDLFGHTGLLMLDADSRELKKSLREVMRHDILENTTQKEAAKAEKIIENLGYKPQIHIREINFFYLEDGLRERIVAENSNFKVLNTDIEFSLDQLLYSIENEPEKFSPNVALRPLYQELILPNLSYTGGPAEIIYWLQLKPVFDKFNIPFPILLPRNFAMIVSKTNHKKMQKLNLTITDLLQDEHTLKQQYLAKNGGEISIEGEQKQLQDLFNSLEKKAIEVDKTLQDFVRAEASRIEKSLEGIEKRIRKAEEKKHEVALSQMVGIKQKLFPNGGLQERSENILNYYANHQHITDELLEVFDPFCMELHVLTENE